MFIIDRPVFVWRLAFIYFLYRFDLRSPIRRVGAEVDRITQIRVVFVSLSTIAIFASNKMERGMIL